MREASNADLQGNIIEILWLISHNSRFTVMTGQMADSRAFWFDKWRLTGSNSTLNAADSDGGHLSADDKTLEDYSSCGYY